MAGANATQTRSNTKAKEAIPKQPEKISRSHVLAHFFQRPKRRGKVQIVKEEGEEKDEKEEATSCFRLFRRTLNIADYEG